LYLYGLQMANKKAKSANIVVEMNVFPSFIDNSLSNLSQNEREEAYLSGYIINIDEKNKEIVKDKVYDFIRNHKHRGILRYVLLIISRATEIRPKNREAHMYLISSLLENFELDLNDSCISPVLKSMLIVRNLIPKNGLFDYNVFDIYEKGSYGRAIADDDIEELIKKLAVRTDEIPELTVYGIGRSVPMFNVSALLSSIKCFKFFLMNGETINDDVCSLAIQGGNSEIVHLCAQNGMSFKGCLEQSVFYHKYELFEWLNLHYNFEPVPLHTCLSVLNIVIFYYYVNNGADINVRCNGSLLGCAAKYGHYNVVNYFANKGFDVSDKDEFGITPLQKSALNGHIDVTEYLVDKGVDVNERCNNGWSALIYASSNNYINIVEYLIDKGADINAKTNQGKNALSVALENRSFDTARYLINRGIDVNNVDKNKRNPMHYALIFGKPDIVDLLKKHGAKVHNKKFTPKSN
jgi:hypothetical protein